MASKREKGLRAEEEFRRWLDRHNIPYWYIQQDLSTFSPALRELFIKRPDFMILVKNFGFILVDVKNKEPSRKHGTIFIDRDEVLKYSTLQRNFNLQVWYAISNELVHFKTWYWIPVSRVLEIGRSREYESRSGGKYFSINLSEFIQVSFDDGLSRIFEKL